MTNEHFDRSLRGFFGTFGAGMGLEISFLQTALCPNELTHISLVEEIPGSERWPIRDLFQRNVDQGRVHTGLLPWLRDESLIKFFNPLTLLLLPSEHFDPESNWSGVPSAKIYSRQSEEGYGWEISESPGYYRFQYASMNGVQYRHLGEVAWDSSRVHLVAIDGQHRLTALRELLRDSSVDFSWDIPVVITGVSRQLNAPNQPTLRLLDVARSMFVYINTQAMKPTESRQILLHDENVSHVCTQEVLQYAHDSDSGALSNHEDLLPLQLFDWRGETQGGRPVMAPAALVSSVELSAWLENYILKTSESGGLERALGLGRSDSLINGVTDNQVSLDLSDHLREHFRLSVLPGIVFLLESFEPFGTYNRKIRNIEKKYSGFSQASAEALSMMRFGYQTARELWPRDVQIAYSDIVEDLLDAKSKLPFLLTHDVGLRSIIFAFGELREHWIGWNGWKRRKSWRLYSEWFVNNLNRSYEVGVFSATMDTERLFLTKNYAGKVLNYRLGDVPKGFGALLSIFIVYASFSESGFPALTDVEHYWSGSVRPTLFSTLKKGYYTHFRNTLAAEHPEWPQTHIKDRALDKARAASHEHLGRLQKQLRNFGGELC